MTSQNINFFSPGALSANTWDQYLSKGDNGITYNKIVIKHEQIWN
jgi:hypothetical protein